MIGAEMKVRYRADPNVIGWVTSVYGDDASVFVDGSVKVVPVGELEPVADLVEMTADEFRVALTRRRLDHPVTDQYLSYKASNTRLFYHQFLPVKKMLESPDQRLLIADEVGTGKTIEAGLIWAELESRSPHGLENVWIICPKSLVGKWRDEMLQRFDFHLEILSSDGLKQALASLRRDGVLSPRFSKSVVNLELLRIEDHATELRANARVSFMGENSEAEFVHARHPLLLLARHLEGSSTSETPWCAGVVPSEMARSAVALVWAVGTLQGYASRSELFCGRVDLETSEVASVPVERAQRMARAMSAPPHWGHRPEADMERVKARAEQTLLAQFKSRSESLASSDRLLADRAKRAVRSHAERQQRRNDDQLSKPDLDARLRTLYSGWNRRIEQETEAKLEEIERRTGVRSSLEVIGMAVLLPSPTRL